MLSTGTGPPFPPKLQTTALLCSLPDVGEGGHKVFFPRRRHRQHVVALVGGGVQWHVVQVDSAVAAGHHKQLARCLGGRNLALQKACAGRAGAGRQEGAVGVNAKGAGLNVRGRVRERGSGLGSAAGTRGLQASGCSPTSSFHHLWPPPAIVWPMQPVKPSLE